jgi:hypothetical protein
VLLLLTKTLPTTPGRLAETHTHTHTTYTQTLWGENKMAGGATQWLAGAEGAKACH